MNYEQAVAKVLETNPKATFVVTSTFQGAPDAFDAYDHTYSSDVLARIYTYDGCTEELTHTIG